MSADDPDALRWCDPYHSPNRLKARAVLTLLLISVALTAAVAARTKPIDPDTAWDSLFYRSMAFNLITLTRPDLDVPPVGSQLWAAYRIPLAQRMANPETYFLAIRNGLRRQPPYAYRVVTPLLARALFSLTGSIDSAFYIITFASLAGAAFFLALTVYSVAGSIAAAATAILLFALNPTTGRFNFYVYILTDPLAFFLTAIAIFALVRRRRGLFFLVCLVGVFNKETMVPLLMCYPLSELLVEHRVRGRSVIAAGSIVAAWFAFTLLLPVPVHTYSLLREFRGLGYIGTVAAAAVATFGVLILGWWRPVISPLLVSLLPFAAGNVAAAWFVGDTTRALAQVLPVLVVAILWLWPLDRLGRM
ncbi:MAG: hypothetical protein M3O94_03325, partial [Actinomycetota bacterium]|nr:hypothetical protein [Actinomycetota bacterium]